MERRRFVANTSNIALLICQDVGEPPTFHRLQILQRFQPENAVWAVFRLPLMRGLLKLPLNQRGHIGAFALAKRGGFLLACGIAVVIGDLVLLPDGGIVCG